MTKVLITGATGFIGLRLKRAGDRLLVRSPRGLPDEVVGDLLDPVSLMESCKAINTIFHCAGYAHAFASSDVEMHWRINCEGTRNLVNVAAAAGVKNFVFLSSVKAMAEPAGDCADEDRPGRPVTPYGQAKRAAEDEVLQAGAKFGMHVVNLRLAMVYGRGGKGNLERMARGIRSGWFPCLPDTGNRRSLIHVEDVVSAIRLVAARPEANGRTYIVADPRAYSGREISNAIVAAPPGLAFSWRAPEWTLRVGGHVGDGLGALLRRPLALNSDVVSRLLDSECYSPARIERELGWRAQVGLEAGIREMLS